MVIKMYSVLSARERQQLFQDLVETSHDLIWQCDHEGRFTYLNPAWETLVGYAREQMLGRTFSDFQSPAMAAIKMEEISRMGESELLRNFRTDFIGRSGDTFHFLLNSKPLFHENGHFIGARGTAQNITERVRAESAVMESEERFRSVLDHSLDVIYRLNLQSGNFDYLSPSVETVSSYSRDELMIEGGRNKFSRVHPDDLPGVQAAFEQVERTGIARVDYRLLTKNGTYRWLSNSMVQVKDDAGRPLYREGNIRDISERKQTEEALRANEQRLKFHLENSPLGVVEWDSDFIVTQWSAEAERIFGLKKEETLGRTIGSLGIVYEEDIPIVERTMQRLVSAQERTVVSSNRNCTRSRGVIKCVWYNSVLLDSSGHMSSVLSLVQDVTEQERAHEALLQSKQRSSAILNAASESIWLMTVEGEILAANKIAVARLGMEPGQVVGKNFMELLPPALAAERMKRVGEMIASGKPVYFQDERAGIFFDHTFYPIKDAEGRITAFAIFSRDITEHRKNEQRLREMYEEAKKHAIVKTQLLNEVNHRVKNNLMVILGLILVEKRQSIAHGHHEVEAMAEKLEGRIKGLLAVHQMLSNSKWEPINLALLAQSICRSVLSSGESAEHEIDLCVEPTGIEVTSRQAGSLALVFNELTVNCMKHAFTDQGRPSIGVRFSTEGERVRIAFNDNGCGYPESVLKRERWSVGLRLIHQLVGHTLGGTLELLNRNGSVTIIELGIDQKN